MGQVQRTQSPPHVGGNCPTCGRPARLLAMLDGPTGDAAYELVSCPGCGVKERMTVTAGPAVRLPKHAPGIMARRKRAS